MDPRFTENLDLIPKIINRHFKEVDRDELKQIGYIKLWECCDLTDAEGKKFWTFAYTCVKNAMMDHVRREEREKRHVALSGCRTRNTPCGFGLEMQDFIDCILVDKRQRECLRMRYMHEMGLREMASQLRMSISATYYLLQRAENIFRAYYAEFMESGNERVA